MNKRKKEEPKVKPKAKTKSPKARYRIPSHPQLFPGSREVNTWLQEQALFWNSQAFLDKQVVDEFDIARELFLRMDAARLKLHESLLLAEKNNTQLIELHDRVCELAWYAIEYGKQLEFLDDRCFIKERREFHVNAEKWVKPGPSVSEMKRIVELVNELREQGTKVPQACKKARVSPRTYQRYKKKLEEVARDELDN